MSRPTTRKELVMIVGVDDSVRRMQGINLSGGRTNAIEVSTNLFGLPELELIHRAYIERKTQQPQLL